MKYIIFSAMLMFASVSVAELDGDCASCGQPTEGNGSHCKECTK